MTHVSFNVNADVINNYFILFRYLDDGLYSEITINTQPAIDSDHGKQHASPPPGINWLNNKVKNLAKRTAVCISNEKNSYCNVNFHK